MSYAPLDVQFDDCPKYADLDAAEMGIIACGITYANRNLTDGRIKRVWPERRFGREGAKLAKRMVDLGIWIERADGDYEIVGFLDHNPSKLDVLAKRRQRAEAGRAGGQASGHARTTRNGSNGEAKGEANAEAPASIKRSKRLSESLSERSSDWSSKPSSERSSGSSSKNEPLHLTALKKQKAETDREIQDKTPRAISEVRLAAASVFVNETESESETRREFETARSKALADLERLAEDPTFAAGTKR